MANSRYPDDRFFIDREEALDAIKKARKILNFSKKKMACSDQSEQTKIF